MRIALLCPRSQRRGAELFSRSLAEGLRTAGHQVLEIYLYPPGATESLPPSPMECCIGAEQRRWTERVIGWDFGLARRLRAVLGSFRPEVIQASGGRTVKYAACLAGSLPTKPLVVYRNIGEPGVWVRGWRRRLLYSRLVFSRVGAVASVGERFLPQLEVQCPNADPIRCIRRGLEPSDFEPTSNRREVRARLGTDAESPVALYAGNLSAEKRVDRLLRVFRTVTAALPEAVLWIAGDGVLRAELEATAARLGISSRVHFLGLRDDIPDLLGAADLVTLSSDTEGVPGVLREAAAAGRPSVATRAGAADELVTDGLTGRLIDREDEEGFARALIELLSDRDLRDRFGAAARDALMSKNLDSKGVAQAFEELYGDGLRTRKPHEDHA